MDAKQEIRRALLQDLPEIPSKYLYDDRGCELFEQITGLPEYYQTRTEVQILEENVDRLLDQHPIGSLVEIGSGVGHKVRLLLDGLKKRGRLRACTLFDINEQVLSQSKSELEQLYPGTDVRTIAGDFMGSLEALGHEAGRLFLFFGGTIGNLKPSDVPAFLSRVGGQMTKEDGFLVGLDLIKDPKEIEAAYNDSQNVTAAFNLNGLNAVNQEFDANFDLACFEHHAFYDEENAWIDVRVRATRASKVRVDAVDLDLNFNPGDEIRTEVSCKYSRESFDELVRQAGLKTRDWYVDSQNRFALALIGK